ncbi:lytic transglycosylase domain-containing protein [Streptomyces chiangmaiensis]|uniref:Lytic murein transglycosylase n=1 Tax=Streptomyces chiangmaiensis TaxID=766497 RepID=A0ABU7F8X8_9ACTN|nr:lytic murein transglycosylase [Streptomyces chiangmaiensis]MED7820559.1 lytic murein transglycosylase [Streptomyces chiangmaiensis]
MAAHFGRRLRKGAATTAVAAAAVAALAASQAPGVTTEDQGRQPTGAQAAPDGIDGGSADDSATGNGGYYTDLPPLNSPTTSPSPSAGTITGITGDSEAGIPATVLDAYKKAAAELRQSKPGCNLPWQLLAAIGKVESGQARGGRVDAEGTTYSKILGPVLDGNGFAHIKDTDNGAYDGDGAYDRAVGPMQFIPSTWAWAGRDGNGDGVEDPNNVYDAALAAGHYLCRADRDLSVKSDRNAAILGYNNSQDYLNTVLSWYEYYLKHTHSIPDGTGKLPTHRSGEKPGTRPKPRTSAPATPKPGKGGSAGPSPSLPGTPKPPTTSPTPTPTDTVDHLANGGTGTLSAMAGDTFGQRIVVKALTKTGKAVAKVRVRFTISGDTDATFTGGESVATVVTDSAGNATAPALLAGEKTGDFQVRALVVGRTVTGIAFPATVAERQADTLVRTSDTALTCTPGGEFTDQVEVKATYKGAVADGVAATATLVKSADDPTENDKGPYFKDADGKTVRTLTGLKTDADGLLKLPKLYADDTTGPFLLRITAAGGATVTVELNVAAAMPPAEPSA